MRSNLCSALLVSLSCATALYSAPSKNSQPTTPPSKPSSTGVFLAHPDYTFEVDLSLLYLQPTGGSLHYAAEADPLPAPTPNWKIHNIDTDYHLGFDIGLRGLFHHTNTYLSVNWERLHSTDSSSTTLLDTDMIGPFFEIGPDASPYKKSKGKVFFHFDEVNLDYGIFTHLGDRLTSNLFAGISFARIKQNLHSKFSDLTGTIVRTIHTPSTFTGAGPQLGLELAYQIVSGFHLTGKLKGSLLVGPQENHTHFAAWSPALDGLGITPPNKQSTKVHTNTQVVPGIEAGLGLSYMWNFGKHYLFQLEAGYQVQTYQDAIQSVDIGSEVNTPPVTPDTVGVYARTFQQHLNHFSLAGPYFLLVVGF